MIPIDIYSIVSSYVDNPHEIIRISNINYDIYKNRNHLVLNNYNKMNDYVLIDKIKQFNFQFINFKEIPNITDFYNEYPNFRILYIKNINDLKLLTTNHNKLIININENLIKDVPDNYILNYLNLRYVYIEKNLGTNNYLFTDKLKLFINHILNNLPNDLIGLELCDDYCPEIFPNNLKHLTFGNDFNRSVNIGYLPNLTSLTLGHGFCKEILPNTLPKTLIFLNIGDKYDESFEVDVLPKNLKYLTLGKNFNSHIENLPENLISLTFGKKFKQSLLYLPKNLRYLRLGDNFNKYTAKWPNKLSELYFGNDFNQPINNLLDGLTRLSFGKNFGRFVSKLPDNIKNLSFGDDFNHPLPSLPKKLVKLTLGKNYNENINNILEFGLSNELKYIIIHNSLILELINKKYHNYYVIKKDYNTNGSIMIEKI